jgi:hypothetical protein
MTKSKVLNVAQLKAKVKAAQKANAAKVTEAALRASLEATLKLESSAELFKSKVALAVISQHTDKLKALVEECSALVDSIPVTNTKTHATRVWAGSRRFTFGAQINLMYQVATGIMYSCADHKQLLLAHTGLDDELIEQFVEAFGTPAYYSRNNNVLVESKMYNEDGAKSAAAVMQSVLGVIVDSSQLTKANFSLEFGRSEVKAQADFLKAEEAIAAVDLVI